MITKDEFLALYEKYMNGQCTPAEKELLDAYRDEMTLPDDKWEDDLINKEEVHNRIWQRLSDSRKVVQLAPRKVNKYRWLQVAALFLAVLFAGLFFLKKEKQEGQSTPVVAKVKQKTILPGGNKAYLTLANGSRITLDDAKNGDLAAKAGIRVSKTGNGMLVYHFNKAAGNSATSTTPEFNTITTPRGGQYQVVLEDGTKVWLNAASSIRFPQAFTGNDRQVELTGEAYFEVAKNKIKPFIVQANGTRVQVLGTHFNINAYSDNNNVTTTLLEGSVRMASGGSTVMLAPGQQGVAVNGAAIKVGIADVQQTMAWKNGLFIFRDLNIVEVMKQVGRWYDVDVEYVGDVKNNEFGGTISKYKNITDLLDIMQLTRSVHYKIEGRRVIIMK
ncbi:FecR domain-containing protein [Mucilaginibacter sabulilitoris]|uniref:FecR domain-containing protein n=1 Tax=Mucilaginibacter sabulilitoris TaxID=1173583 RepID=A0ABZ0TKI6_9SPHI|nr:FecR domain-containing protein [Mucilaginibacter sabulilitoris]WPU92708.1 FecR domain-containing protein [Mucilaginibacter sabulilitoris]